MEEIMRFNYTGKEQSITLLPGRYKFECWGAQGGYYSSSHPGGKGGYSCGYILITELTDVFIYVGGQGEYSSTPSVIGKGGFNGGGSTGTSAGQNNYAIGNGGGGGGASDIRLRSNSLFARVIVAGGGAGSFYGNYTVQNAYIGGYGGGLNGGNGQEWCCRPGYGAGQTSCPRNTAYCPNGSAALAGEFGRGSNGTYSVYISGTGGGGGWYGGQAGGSGCGSATGGGGSGYIYTIDTSVNYPSGCLLDTNDYLYDADIFAGNVSFSSPDKTLETGHSGNGCVVITVLEVHERNYITDRLNSNIFKNIFPEEPIDMSFINRSMENTPTSTEDIKQDNHGFQVNDVLYFDGKLYHKAIAENSSKATVAGIVLKISSPNIFTLMNSGMIPYEFENLTDTSFLYLSDKTPGTLVHFREITNTAYVPVAVYTDHKIIINIQQGTYGNNLVPYQSQDNPFDSYTEQELDDIANQIINGVIS